MVTNWLRTAELFEKIEADFFFFFFSYPLLLWENF